MGYYRAAGRRRNIVIMFRTIQTFVAQWARRSLAIAAAVTAALAGAASAQMVSGEKIPGYDSTFNVVLNQRQYPYRVISVGGSIPGNVVWPGEQPSFTFQIQNNLDRAIKAAGKVDVIAYGTHGTAGDIWAPVMFKIADVQSIPIEVDIAPGKHQNVTVQCTLPETKGAYALVIDLGEHGRQFATSCIRTFKPDLRRVQYPSLSLDNMPVDILHRLGVQAVRLDVAFVPPDHPEFERRAAELEARLRLYHEKNITVLLLVGDSPVPQPLGRPRPHLNADDVMQETKSDMAWLPSEDERFSEWVTSVAAKYGWPNGPVTAFSLWNEPWEGISISGWGADMLRYREIYTAMANGVERARKEAKVQVLVAGCDSSSNTFDKLFPDGTDAFLPKLDVCTIHYQGLESPALYRMWRNREGPNGRVRIWDTESWIANTDDRVAAVVATNRAAGYDRAMGVYHGNISWHRKVRINDDAGGVKDVEQIHVWSTAAAVAAATHFIGERPFRELMFKNGLPWVMVFDGAEGRKDDGTIVVVGDLTDTFGRERLLFRTVQGLSRVEPDKQLRKQIAELPPDAPEVRRKELEQELKRVQSLADANMHITADGEKFKLFDFYGNEVAAKGSRITIPLDGRGFFLRADGSEGSFDALTKAVASASIEGIEPLEIIPHDMLAPIDTRPEMRVRLTNIYNRPISGELAARLGDLQVDHPTELRFEPHETKWIAVKITGGEAVPSNLYPLSMRFDAGVDGVAEHEEEMRVNVIARRTIAVDGNLDDWKDVLPQTIRSDESNAPTQQEAAWFPFVKYDSSIKKGQATSYLAYDDQFFYFGAKVADTTPHPGTLRFEKRDDDVFFYPELTREYDVDKTFVTKPGAIGNEVRKPFALLKPGTTSGERSYELLQGISKAIRLNLEAPADKPRDISVYFIDDDTTNLGRAHFELQLKDRSTGRLIDKKEVREFGRGTYVTMRVRGQMELTIRSRNWLPVTLAGVFVDPFSGPTAEPAASRFRIDEKTEGNWIGTYGREGHYVVGTMPNYPADVSVDVLQTIEKKEHRWPGGVRRFSYRMRPILPSGNAPNFDNIQIAFNAIPLAEDPVVFERLPGTMPKFTGYRCTDYEFALNKVADAYGGGTEIWRLTVPDAPRKHFYPRQPAAPWEGPVKTGQLAIAHEDGTRTVETAIPWSEIPHVRKLLDEGKPVKFSFRINDDAGVGCLELAKGRSVSRRNSAAFAADWTEHWANEVEFDFER